ncbi:MAG: ABC transporter substrate-binding protein [Gemmatimonadota bacterium]
MNAPTRPRLSVRAQARVARTTAAVAAVVLIAPFATGCGGGAGDGAGSDAPLVLGYALELQGLNPLVSTDQNANELIWYLLFTPLVVYDSAFHPVPGLAESWDLSPEGVTFRLREDARWHDGVPVTAADVVFTFERAKDPATASPLASAYLASVSRAEALGDHAVRFTFSAPHAQPLEDFFWPPVPKHLLENVPPAAMMRAPFNRSPVGSGPYRFVRWDVNRQLVFEADSAHAPSLGGPPEIARVVYRIVPDRTTLLAELLSGGVQVDGPVSPGDAGAIETAPGARLLSFPWRQFAYVGWNTRREPFTSPAVRRALALAIDREAIVETILEGHASPAASVIPPWHRLAPDVEPLPHDPEEAARILEAEGWTDADGDGFREKAGRPLAFELLTNQRNPVYGDLAQVLQAQLARVGAAVTPRLLEWQTVLSLHRGRDFDAVLTNWVLDNFRVDPRPLYHSEQAAREGSANRSSYASPVADSLMEIGARTLDDAEARAIWTEFARVVGRDQPITPLFWQDELAGVSRRLENVRMDARGELVTLPRWRWREPEDGR